jgi:hypothetical protein
VNEKNMVINGMRYVKTVWPAIDSSYCECFTSPKVTFWAWNCSRITNKSPRHFAHTHIYTHTNTHTHSITDSGFFSWHC